MSRFLLLSVFALLGVFPCRSQDVIYLNNKDSIGGRVVWEKSRGDDLHYMSAVSAGDSLPLFVPRHRVEYVVMADGRRMLYRGERKGWCEWSRKSFDGVPQHKMLYGVSGGIITDGWSADISAMRYLNRANFFGVGGFVRYAETALLRKSIRLEHRPIGYKYEHRAMSLGGQIEFRGYARRLKTYYYVQAGVGFSYHKFSDWHYEWKQEYAYMNEWSYIYDEQLASEAPTSKWAATVHLRVGVYTRLTRGLYADLSAGCTGRFIDHTMSEVSSVFKTSDMYPFGVSLGLRFGRERR